MPANALSSPKVAFWREVCGSNKKSGGKAPSWHMLLVAGSTHTGGTCAQGTGLAASLLGHGSAVRLTVVLPPCQGKSGCASQQVIEKLRIASGKANDAST